MGEKACIVSKRTFYNIWNIAFPWVKIRKVKKVSGKCQTCCDLIGYRCTTRDLELKGKISELFALHRQAFMAARMAYYKIRYVMFSLSPNIPQSNCSYIDSMPSQTRQIQCLSLWMVWRKYTVSCRGAEIVTHSQKNVRSTYRVFMNTEDAFTYFVLLKTLKMTLI
jgi:hypothetical protein